MSRTFLNGITDPRSPGVGKVYTSDASGNGGWAAAASGGGLTGWVDVTTFPSTPVLTTNTGAQNVTAINAILAASSNGSTIYIPHGIYQFNAAWTMPTNKAFTFQGQGSNRAGNPGTAFTEIQLTAALATAFIALANVWYTNFRNLCFTAGVTQSAGGSCVDVGNNVGTNFIDCSFQSPNTTLAPTTFWQDVLVGTSTNSWNQAVISGCNFSAFKGRGVLCDGTGSSLVISNSVIQGNWGGFTGTPAANSATACIEGLNVGALQINDCDILGAINNLLLDPGAGKVCASVFCTNTYFDNSAGSCIKIAGAGATVRARFDTCSFTTAGTNYSTPGTALSAFEIAGSFAFTATAGQGLNIINCNFLNTFGTTGTTNGLLVTNAADFSVAYSNFAGWTNGLQVTPIATLNVTKFNFTNNVVGTAGGYSGITTGVLVNSGSAYKTYTIIDNDFNGCTTPVSDSGSTAISGGSKYISNNAGGADGLRAAAGWPGQSGTVAALGSTFTTTEVILAQVWAPANTLKVGTLIRAQSIVGLSATATTNTYRIHIGTVGSAAGDPSLIAVGPSPSTASAAQHANLLTCVNAVGAAATHIGSGSIAVGILATTTTPTPVATSTFNSTVGNWVTFTAINTAGATGTTVRAAFLEVISPS